ncbi:MAG: motility associated factor glycosyltransferase family protein, partial [Clostridium sp.]
LLGVNIDPDFMAIIDGSQASYELVENYLDKTNTNLIYNEMTNSKILDNYKGPKISSAQSGFMKEILGEDIVDIIKGGSVANAMTFIAAFMGCNPIIFVGQDLAYTDNKGHAECAKTDSVSIDAKENYYKSNDVYVEGIDGKEVRTSLSLKAYKESLEDIVESFKDIKFINATEGGAAIRGTEVRKLKEVLEEFEDIKEKDTKVKNISDKEILKKTIDGLKDNLEASNKVISLTSKAMKSLERFKKAYFKNDNSSVNRINQELNRYEKEINEEIPKLSIVNSVIYDLSYNIECSEQFVVNKSDSKKRVVEKKLDLNTEIYKGMNRICKDSIKKIEDTLNIMEKKYAKLS